MTCKEKTECPDKNKMISGKIVKDIQKEFFKQLDSFDSFLIDDVTKTSIKYVYNISMLDVLIKKVSK